MLSPDTLLAGKYRIMSAIGEGGYGQVYLGYDEAIERYVAIKELLRDAATSSPEEWRSYQQRFRKEAQITSQFNHSNVASAYALETDAQGNIYLILEYVDGGSLKQLIEERGYLDPEEVIEIGIDLCRAIEVLFQRDIVHRDIKPSNILLTRSGVAKLTDLGVAQVGHETRRTQDAIAHPGTPAYKSPEQATATGYLDDRSDIYSLGLVLYEALTGRMYVRNRVAPQDYNEHVPPALNAVVMKALEEDPLRRYQSAETLRRDLERVRDQDLVGQLRIVLGRVPTRRVVAVAGLALLLALMMGVYRLGGLVAVLRGDSPAAVAPETPERAEAVSPGIAEAPLPQPGAIIVLPTSAPTAEPTATEPSPLLEDLYEPDEDVPAAIAPGETQMRGFGAEGDVDRVTFRVKEGLSYVVTTSNLAVGVDTQLEVLVGDQMLTNDDIAPGLLASQVSFTAVEDGTAIVSIRNDDQYGPSRTFDVSVMMTLPTETPGWTDTAVPTTTPTPARQATQTPRPTLQRTVATATRVPTSTRTPTWTPRATSTRKATSTRTHTRTRTPTRTNTPTRTPTRTNTPTHTSQPTDNPSTNTPEPPTHTPKPTNTAVPERTRLPVRPTGPPVR